MCKNKSNDPAVQRILDEIKHYQILKSAASGDDNRSYGATITKLKRDLETAKKNAKNSTSQTSVSGPSSGPQKKGA